jgi:hypothetical protein
MRGVWMAAAVVGLVGCADTEPAGMIELMGEQMKYHVQLTPEPSPPVAGDVVLDVTLMDHATMEGVAGATLTVEPWMVAMNHGVEGTPTVSDDGGGDYTVGFAFSMPGSWEVRIDIDGASGVDRVVAELEVE